MICRLCLTEAAKFTEIFDNNGSQLNVAALIAKHFWFEPKMTDPHTAVCCGCLAKITDFHEFYVGIQEAQRQIEQVCYIKSENQLDAVAKYKYELEEQEVCDLEPQVMVDGEEFGASEVIDETTLTTKESECLTKAATEIEPITSLNVRRSNRHKSISSSGTEKGLGRAVKRRIEKDVQTTAKVEMDSQSKIKRKRGRPRKTNGFVTDLDTKQAEEKEAVLDNSQEGARAAEAKTKFRETEEKIALHANLFCDICKTKQESFTLLRKHMKEAHNVVGYATCCKKKFYKRFYLVEHVEWHINPDHIRCIECNKSFADSNCLRNHQLLKHQKDELKVFKCDRCPRKFVRQYLLDQHRVIHDERTHNCDQCSKRFPSVNTLSTHKKLYHNNYGTMCDICAKVIKGPSAFKRHQLEHAGIVAPKAQCTICQVWLKNEFTLRKHMRRQHLDTRTHVCHICGKVATNHDSLRSHKKYVHAERTFQCSVCSKAFKRALNLKEHMTQHTGEVLYNCPHCTRTFNSNANMHSHRKLKHPKEFEETRKLRKELAAMPVEVKETEAADGRIA